MSQDSVIHGSGRFAGPSDTYGLADQGVMQQPIGATEKTFVRALGNRHPSKGQPPREIWLQNSTGQRLKDREYSPEEGEGLRQHGLRGGSLYLVNVPPTTIQTLTTSQPNEL
ncbi:hypothetical protein R1flu_015663 [Riccia fluitans]|uniref:Uncharacterized protein n=1 Tax=Riccia fluitans TaxID=41844 RepID=A0ABD1YJN6_9MARC